MGTAKPMTSASCSNGFIPVPAEFIKCGAAKFSGHAQIFVILHIIRIMAETGQRSTGPMTAHDFARLLKCNLRTVQGVLSDARRRGLIETEPAPGVRFGHRFRTTPSMWVQAPDYEAPARLQAV